MGPCRSGSAFQETGPSTRSGQREGWLAVCYRWVGRSRIVSPGFPETAGESAVRRLTLFCTVLGFLLVGIGIGRLTAQDDRIEVEAQVGATYQEADEGYFSFGQDTMVVTKQGSDLQKWLKAHVGQKMKVKFEPEAPANK